MRRPAAVAVLSCALLGALAQPALAGDDRAWRALAVRMAQPWPDNQNEDGTLRDYVHGGNAGFGRYGDAMMGLGLLQTGVRENDSRLLASGMKALGHAVRQEQLQRDKPSVFENLAIAAAYNLARIEIPDDPQFSQERGIWEAWLRRVKPIYSLKGRSLGNKYLVEAVAQLELARTELRSDQAGTVLADPAGARAEAERFVNRFVAEAADAALGDAGDNFTSMLSDRPNQPIAYHGLAAGMLARAVELMGPRASITVLRVLEQAANASWVIAAPDGDAAYMGRSQELSWALAFTSSAAETAALFTDDDTLAARFRALSLAAITRLRDEHGVGPNGLWLTPAMRTVSGVGRRGLDTYAGAVVYGGLTLVAVNWAIEQIADNDAGFSELFAARSRSAIFPLARATFGVSRWQDVWFAVKQQPTSNLKEDDLRDDFGLMAMKVRQGDGWRDAIPLRPITKGKPDTAGPLLKARGVTGVPFGEEMIQGPQGTLVVKGGFRSRSGKWLRKDIKFRFEPIARGVRMSFPVRRGDRFEMSSFVGSLLPAPRISYTVHAEGASPSPGRARALPRASARSGFASGADPSVTRVRHRFAANRRGRMSVYFQAG